MSLLWCIGFLKLSQGRPWEFLMDVVFGLSPSLQWSHRASFSGKQPVHVERRAAAPPPVSMKRGTGGVFPNKGLWAWWPEDCRGLASSLLNQMPYVTGLPQVPGRSGLHRHHSRHALQAGPLSPGPLLHGAEWRCRTQWPGEWTCLWPCRAEWG